MRSLLYIFALLVIGVITGCGDIVIEQPQRESEPVPHNPSQPGEQQVEREVLAFTSPWCGGCRADKPKIAELRRQGVKITEINVDEQPDLAARYNIQSLPTYVVLENGTEVQRTQSITAILAIVKWLLIRIISLI